MIRSILLFFLLLMGPFSTWAQEQNSAYTVGVDGLACPFCAYGIEKQLHKLDGVELVEIDIKLGQAIIKMLEGRTLERIQVEMAIEKAGFSLRSFRKIEDKETP